MKYPKNQIELEKAFGTEKLCREYLIALRFPDGFACARCGGSRHWKQTRDRLTCADCLREISPLNGTLFHKSRLPLTLWFRAAWWITNQKHGISALGLQRALGLGSYRTAWLLLHKLRSAMVRPGRELLTGEVEVDETLLGGVGIAPGLGPDARWKKHMILIAAEKVGPKIGRIRMQLIKDNTRATLLKNIQKLIEPGSVVETDGWQAYMYIAQHGYRHRRIVSSTTRSEKREESLLPRVHLVASLFKRWILGTYHGRTEPKYLQHYLDEYVFRFNRRNSGSRGLLFQRLLENAVKIKGAPYRKITQTTQ